MFESLLLWGQSFVESYGMLGLFIVILIGSSPLPVPVEVFALTMVSLGASPLATVVLATIGATLGGMLTYSIGYGIIKISGLESKMKEKGEKARRWFEHHGAYAVFLFALAPLPYDAIALVSGAARMRITSFVTATLTGRLLRYALVVSGGQEVLKVLYPFFSSL
ncbi:YqaA family protein [Candidatus Pyrohabitans sp.]